MATNPPRKVIQTLVFTLPDQLAETPGAPVMVLPEDANRIRATLVVSGVAAIGETADKITIAGIGTGGFVIVPGAALGGLNANKSMEIESNSPIWAVGYNAPASATVLRILVERYSD